MTKKLFNMNIAVPFHNGYVNEHFGHSDQFAVYTIDQNNQIINRDLITADEGCACKSEIGALLAREGVTIMLVGNIGAGAIHHLYTEGIEIVRGCAGKAEEAVNLYLKGELRDGGQTCTEHHGHDHGHHPHH